MSRYGILLPTISATLSAPQPLALSAMAPVMLNAETGSNDEDKDGNDLSATTVLLLALNLATLGCVLWLIVKVGRLSRQVTTLQ